MYDFAPATISDKKTSKQSQEVKWQREQCRKEERALVAVLIRITYHFCRKGCPFQSPNTYPPWITMFVRLLINSPLLLATTTIL